MSMLVAVSSLMPVSFANQAVLMVKMIAGGNLQKASGEMNAHVARLEFIGSFKTCIDLFATNKTSSIHLSYL